MTNATSDDPDTYPAAGQPTSCLVLHSNRHATVVLDDGTQVRLRPPTVGEWRKIRAAYAAAQARLDGITDPTALADALYGYDPADDPAADPDSPADREEPPYAAAFAVVLQTLGNTRLDPDGQPLWAGGADPYLRLYAHWRKVDVVLAAPPADTPDVAPGGDGTVSDTAPPAPAMPPQPPGDPVPFDGSDMPTFDLAAAQAEHAAAGTLNPPRPPSPLVGGGLRDTPGGATVAPVGR